MLAISVDNSPRECGTMVDDGYYFGASVSAFGTLRAAWYPFGDFVSRFIDCDNIPSIGQFIGHFPLSAAVWSAQPFMVNDDLKRMYPEEVMARPRFKGIRQAFGTSICLFDHVGANNYTPYSFLQEMLERGPNRHTAPMTAHEIAKYTVVEDRMGNRWPIPFPIVFTQRLPVFRSERVRDAIGGLLLEWGNIEDRELTWEPTIENGLSPRIDEYDGSDHFGTLLIHAMHIAKRGNVAQKNDETLKRIMEVVDNGLFVEQPFCGSTITNIHKFNGTLSDDDRRSGIVSSFARN